MLTKARCALELYLMVVCKKTQAQAQKLAHDLLDWFNCTEPDRVDLERLALLVKQGRFQAWNCITCPTRVYEGRPIDWSHFQGVRQVDYTSFPAGHHRQCDHCRMLNPLGSFSSNEC